MGSQYFPDSSSVISIAKHWPVVSDKSHTPLAQSAFSEQHGSSLGLALGLAVGNATDGAGVTRNCARSATSAPESTSLKMPKLRMLPSK